MKCPECGQEVAEEAKACPACGASLLEKTRTLPPGEIAPPPPADVAVPAGEPSFVVAGPIDKGVVFQINKGLSIIGRDPEADIFLNDVTVSRRHAQLRREEGGVYLKDLGSLNGTFVNGRIISEEVRLQDGDEVQIGRFRLTFYARGVEND